MSLKLIFVGAVVALGMVEWAVAVWWWRRDRWPLQLALVAFTLTWMSLALIAAHYDQVTVALGAMWLAGRRSMSADVERRKYR